MCDFQLKDINDIQRLQSHDTSQKWQLKIEVDLEKEADLGRAQTSDLGQGQPLANAQHASTQISTLSPNI